mmetsp:Transcript_27141/g.71410  ORF Transcript_27141/g.71410 Transcript_27141/m.71410 type:complete len:245 (-) Transcript_27141:1932-2666(-)
MSERHEADAAHRIALERLSVKLLMEEREADAPHRNVLARFSENFVAWGGVPVRHNVTPPNSTSASRRVWPPMWHAAVPHHGAFPRSSKNHTRRRGRTVRVSCMRPESCGRSKLIRGHTMWRPPHRYILTTWVWQTKQGKGHTGHGFGEWIRSDVKTLFLACRCHVLCPGSTESLLTQILLWIGSRTAAQPHGRIKDQCCTATRMNRTRDSWEHLPRVVKTAGRGSHQRTPTRRAAECIPTFRPG